MEKYLQIDEYRSALYPWVVILLCLAAFLPPLLIQLSVNSSIGSMESIALTASQETWIRQVRGEQKALLLPTLNGEPRLQKPPLNVWLNMLSWRGLDPDTASSEVIVGRARRNSVLLGLAALAGTFWIGYQLGRLRLAVSAMLITGTFFLFLQQARIATYDIQLTGWVTLAVAAALWSLGSQSPSSLRRAFFPGWVLAGLLLGAAVMTKGPLALFLFSVPVLIGVILAPGRRLVGMIGLVLALATAITLAAPWFIYVFQNVPGAFAKLFGEYQARYYKKLPPWYYLILVLLAFPWSLWVAGSLSVPFHGRISYDRYRTLFPWLWFVLLIISFSIPRAKQPRHIVPILPAMGLLTAQFWLLQEGLLRWSRRLRRMHWGLIHACSVGFLLYLLLEVKLHQAGLIRDAMFAEINPMVKGLFGGFLIGLAAIGAWVHSRGNAMAALALTAGWMICATTFGFDAYSRLPGTLPQYRAEAEKVAACIGGKPVVYLMKNPDADERPSREFLFYSRCVVPPMGENELEGKLRSGGQFYVIIRAEPANEALMAKLGFIPVFEFRDGSVPVRRLFQSSPQAQNKPALPAYETK